MTRQMLSGLFCFLLLVAPGLARAAVGVPVRLPAHERAADWQEALTIAGLTVGVPGDGAWVDVSVGPTSWTVRVRDLDGVVHVTPVAPPVSEQDREDLAMLAASLLQPVAVPTSLKAAAKEAAATAAPPPVKPPSRPATTPAAAALPGPPSAEVSVIVPPSEPTAHARLEARVGLAAEIRLWSVPTGLVWTDVQWVGSSPLRPSVGGSLAAPAALPRIAGSVSYWSAELWAGAWYAAPAPLRFDFGVTLGLAGRSFSKSGEPVGIAWIPVFSTRLEVPILVTPGLLIEPGVHIQLDARQVHLESRQTDTTDRFADWSARVGIGFRPFTKNSSPD